MILESINKAKFVITIEEGILAGGFGSAILELMADKQIFHKPILRLGIPDKFIEQGTRKQLLAECKLDAEGIANAILAFNENINKK